MGFVEPMEVQSVTIPLAREGRDILVQSRTGSGKTAAFAFLSPTGLPTRGEIPASPGAAADA